MNSYDHRRKDTPPAQHGRMPSSVLRSFASDHASDKHSQQTIPQHSHIPSTTRITVDDV